MTALTRRDALLLTATVTAASAAMQSAAVADNPPASTQSKEDATILEVPSGIVDGSSIPITVKIPGTDIARQAGDLLTNVTIDLYLQKDVKDDKSTRYQIFSATLSDKALPKDPKLDIYLMTSLKIVYDPFAAPPSAPVAGQTPSPPTQFTVNLFADIHIKYKTAQGAQEQEKVFTAHQSLTLLPQDCAPSNVAVLRLGLKPPTVETGQPMLVRAIVPAAGIPYALNTITCTKSDDTHPESVVKPLDIKVNQWNVFVRQKDTYVKQNGTYIADEVSVSFYLYPEKAGVITMTLDYHDQSEQDPNNKTDLIASTYVVAKPPSS